MLQATGNRGFKISLEDFPICGVSFSSFYWGAFLKFIVAFLADFMGKFQLWEMKMMQACVICGPIERSLASKPTQGGPITAVHNLNVPYEGTEEYETPPADLLFPPTPLQAPIQTPLPGTAQTPLPGNMDNYSMYNIPTGPTDHPTPISDANGNPEMKAGRPSPYMT